jgi:hypothetical protein
MVSVLLFVQCSEFTVKTDHGFFGPDVYELTNGEISIKYYNGNCCCIAKEVLMEVQRRIESNELDWTKLRDKTFADQYLQKVCDELRESDE